MRLLDRYLLRELLIPLGYCLAGFFIFWVAFDLIQQLDKLLDLKLTPGEITRYYLILAPKFLVIVLPIGLLLALLMTLTGLARHNEIVAMRAAGLSLWRVAAPFFLVGLAASAVLFLANEFWVPDSIERAEEVRNSHLARRPGAEDKNLLLNFGFTNVRDKRSWHVGVFNQRTAEMINPRVFWTLPDGSQRQLTADRAIPTNGAWLFLNAQIYRESQAANMGPVPLLRTNELLVTQFTETPDAIRTDIKMSRRMVGHRAKEADVPIFEIIEYLRFNPAPPIEDRRWLYTELHGRLAMPWMCLVVVLIALPFGAASGRRNVFFGVAGAIFICFAFYVLQQVGLALGVGGYVPAWLGGWFPNLAFGGIGLWLTARVR